MNNNDEKNDEYVLKKLLHLFLFLVVLVVIALGISFVFSVIQGY